MTNDTFLQKILRTNANQIAVYIHLPWCVKKCPYCDFNSHTFTDTNSFSDYTEAVLSDIAQTELAYKNVASVFFGGGTPSLFSATELEKILDKLEQKYSFASDIEITLEANPNSSDYKKFADYYAIGINRLSIGAQSFSDKQLKLLGRAHAGHEIISAFSSARSAGFNNINLDIMHGLPEQCSSQAISDLTKAIELKPEHISWYQLTIEPNTAFAAMPPKLPSSDLRADIQDKGHKLLEQHGYSRFEISAFSKPGMQCQHNLHVWDFNDYIGFGAGAHSKITISGKQYRSYRHYHPKQFIKLAEKTAKISLIKESELLLEYMINRARILKPICKKHVMFKTKLTELELKKHFQSPIEQGLMLEHATSWQITELGINHLNSLLVELSSSSD